MGAFLSLTGAGASGAAGGGATGTAVDLALNLESGTNGSALTVADLNAATLKSAAAAGTWDFPASATAPTISTTSNFDPTPRKLKVGGTTQNEGTRNVLHTTASPDQKRFRYILTTDAAQVSIGFGLFFTNEGTFNFYNWGELTGNDGKYNALHHRDNSPSQVGVEDFSSSIGGLITMGSGQWYWMTMLYDLTNHVIKLRVYNPSSSWAQVGSESSLAVAGYSTNCKSFMLGRTDAHGVFGAATMRTDCVGVCLSTGVGATFPLLPT